jgi:hypothetical protein
VIVAVYVAAVLGHVELLFVAMVTLLQSITGTRALA